MSGRISLPFGTVSEPSGLMPALAQTWFSIRRHLALFFIICIAVWLLGLLTIAMLRPIYTATATVALATQNLDPLAPVGATQADQFQDDDLPQTIAAAMQSRDVASAVLAQFPAAASAHATLPPAVAQQAAIDEFLKHLTITPEAHSRIIDIDVAARSAPLAQALANAVVQTYQKISLAQQTRQSSQTEDWLASRIQDLQTRWLAAVQAADDYRSANHVTDASDGVATIPLIDQQITAAATSLEAAQASLIDAQALHDVGHTASSTDQSATASMLAQLETQRAQLAGEFGPNYPKLATLDAQIAALRRAPASYGTATTVSPAASLAAAKARVDSLTARLNQLTQQEAADSLTQANYLTLKAEAENAHTAYSTFVEHAAEVADRASLLQPAIILISPAGLPLRPSFPDKPKLALGVLLLGLIGGAAACRVKDQPLSLTPSTNLGAEVPLLASLPFVPPLPGRIIAHHILDAPGSRTSEATRNIANALRGRSVLVVSASPQEGRTTIATWLATALRQNGEKILLISADRQPNAAALGRLAPMRLGWTDLIFGKAEAEQLIETDPVSKLDLMAPGSIIGHPLEPSDMNRIRAVLTALQNKYDLIVIDPPPLSNANDGLMLSAVVDETIFICRWQHSAPRIVTTAIGRLQAKGAHVAGLVISMVGKNADLALSDPYDGRQSTLIPQLHGTP